MDYFDLKTAKFGCNRDPLTPDIQCEDYVGRVAADFQLRLVEVVYWRSNIHTEGTAGKVQTVGWQWELGLRISKGISLYHEHHSRHRMDATVPDYNGDGRPDKFPVEDSYGIRFNFYMNPRPTRGLVK